jgi:hypothetical protein
MANDAYDYLPSLRIGKIKNAIITGADSPAISISEFLATMRKRIVFQSQDCFGNATLNI